MHYRLDLDCVFMKYNNQNPITFRFIILDMKHEINPFQTLWIFSPTKWGGFIHKVVRFYNWISPKYLGELSMKNPNQYIFYHYQAVAMATVAAQGLMLLESKSSWHTLESNLGLLFETVLAWQQSWTFSISICRQFPHWVLLISLVHCTNPYLKPFPLPTDILPALNSF